MLVDGDKQGMELDINKFILSNLLAHHPVLTEKVEYKIKYLNMIQYFIYKYSKNDDIALAMLENYKTAFLQNKDITLSDIDSINKSYAKEVMRYKIKSFKVFTYRYSLLCDVLQINAFDDEEKAQIILNEIKSLFKTKYHEKFNQLYNVLYYNETLYKGFDLIEYQLKSWKLNKEFFKKTEKRILITANMSAGKSTLINALIGKNVNKTMNDACTAKIHYIYDKSFEDGYSHKWDYEHNLNADYKTLLENDGRNFKNDIYVSTNFFTFTDKHYRMCIIDTPGVNSSMNKDHGYITKECVLNKNYDTLIYMINAENAGTEDDLKYLTFIKEKISQKRIIFILNKLDRFRKSEDSIYESILLI